MSEATTNRATGAQPDRSTGDRPDPGAAGLMARLRDYLAARADRATTIILEPIDRDAFAAETGFAPRRQGKPEVVLGADVALELGHPSTASQALVVTTDRPELVRDRTFTRIGPELHAADPAAGAGGAPRWPFAQVVLIALAPDARPDPFELESTGFLIHRLPGYMVRSIPGRLWVRISRRGVDSGLTLTTVARALDAAFRELPGVAAVEVLMVTGDAADVAALAPIALEAQVLAGRHKKLALSIDGDLECSEMSCETCDEKPVCDDLRDVVRQRRHR